jgi:hypothetical protein
MSNQGTHWTIVCDILDELESAKDDEYFERAEFIAKLQNKMAIMVSKMIVHPQNSNYCLFSE